MFEEFCHDQGSDRHLLETEQKQISLRSRNRRHQTQQSDHFYNIQMHILPRNQQQTMLDIASLI